MVNFRLIGLMIALAVPGTAFADDWRKTADTEGKVDRLVDILPGTSHRMWQIGERYRNLYWAARNGQWRFAEYQADKIEGLVEDVQVARPKRAKTAQAFLDAVFPGMTEAAASGDWQQFESAFSDMQAACVACHEDNGYGFIRPTPEPRRGNSPALRFERETTGDD